MPLKTKRLSLRSWELADAKALALFLQDETLLIATGLVCPRTPTEMQHFIATLMANPYAWAIVQGDSQQLIGGITLDLGQKGTRVFDSDEGEVGFWLGQDYRHQGYMSEALTAVCHFAFENLQLQTLWMAYFDGNHDSQRFQKRFHCQYETSLLVLCPVTKTTRIEYLQKLTVTTWRQMKQ